MFGARSLRMVALVVGCALLAVTSSRGQNKKEKLYIGVSGTASEHLDPDTVQEGIKSLRSIIENETGHVTDVVVEPDWKQLVADLKAGKRNLAGLCGFEFAWAQAKDPKIIPLMTIINEKQLMYAHVLVKKDNPAAKLADLAGKSLALAKGIRPHCRLYVDRQCDKLGRPTAQFLGKLAAPANSEDALDDVVDGLVDAVVVEGVALDAYMRRKPARFAQLKEIAKSEPFPSSVVAYYQGGIDAKTLQEFREGMINLNDTAEGRRMLTLWKQTAFENIPRDFDKIMDEIGKAYPEKK
jgi:ABC-type phosphate/phosphonate transport system substrate-binding protein